MVELGQALDTDWDDYPYGVCPAQVDGVTRDGAPFYFRCRHARWTLALGEPGWHRNCLAWPCSYTERIWADGEGNVESKSEVDGLLDDLLGEGWSQSSWEDLLFTDECGTCGEDFQTDGSTVCSECLVKMLKGD